MKRKMIRKIKGYIIIRYKGSLRVKEMRPEMSIEYIRKYPSECLPDFHVGVIDHLAITVPHAQV